MKTAVVLGTRPEIIKMSPVIRELAKRLHPRLGRGWARKGKRLKVPTTSQHRERLNISGWVAPLLGRKGVIRTAKGNREGFLQVLQHMLEHHVAREFLGKVIEEARRRQLLSEDHIFSHWKDTPFLFRRHQFPHLSILPREGVARS